MNWFGYVEILLTIIYAILLILNIFNCAKHGKTFERGYIFLVLVSCCSISNWPLPNVVKIGSDILRHPGVLPWKTGIWGIILSDTALFPLLCASLAFLKQWFIPYEFQTDFQDSPLEICWSWSTSVSGNPLSLSTPPRCHCSCSVSWILG